jgi:hypothetical protein
MDWSTATNVKLLLIKRAWRDPGASDAPHGKRGRHPTRISHHNWK